MIHRFLHQIPAGLKNSSICQFDTISGRFTKRRQEEKDTHERQNNSPTNFPTTKKAVSPRTTHQSNQCPQGTASRTYLSGSNPSTKSCSTADKIPIKVFLQSATPRYGTDRVNKVHLEHHDPCRGLVGYLRPKSIRLNLDDLRKEDTSNETRSRG